MPAVWTFSGADAGMKPQWANQNHVLQLGHWNADTRLWLDAGMPILYPVGPGTILRCDYSMGGFRAPEMTKPRPAVVVSPRLPYRDGLCAVIPLSTTEPRHSVPYVVRIELNPPLPSPYDSGLMWAKCDMIATVSFERLDLFRTARDLGRRKYLTRKLSQEQMTEIKVAILAGIGIS